MWWQPGSHNLHEPCNEHGRLARMHKEGQSRSRQMLWHELAHTIPDAPARVRTKRSLAGCRAASGQVHRRTSRGEHHTHHHAHCTRHLQAGCACHTLYGCIHAVCSVPGPSMQCARASMQCSKGTAARTRSKTDCHLAGIGRECPDNRWSQARPQAVPPALSPQHGQLAQHACVPGSARLGSLNTSLGYIQRQHCAPHLQGRGNEAAWQQRPARRISCSKSQHCKRQQGSPPCCQLDHCGGTPTLQTATGLQVHK